jgi:acetyl esterase
VPFESPAHVASIIDRTVPGPAGAIPVRVYTPEGEGPFPLFVYIHGGGWVLGDLDGSDPTCRAIANEAECVVVSVDYRLAPEHKFPVPVEDVYAATVFVARHAHEFGGDGARIAVGGDSAGGNLSAAVSLMARDRGGPSLALQVLNYPVIDRDFDSASYEQNGDGYFLTAAMMRWFWGHYLRNDADALDPYAAPLRAGDLSGLAPALVITAEFDPLLSEGEAYASALRDAGVPATLRRYDGMIHGFISMMQFVPQGRQAISEIAAALREAFAAKTPA